MPASFAFTRAGVRVSRVPFYCILYSSEVLIFPSGSRRMKYENAASTEFVPCGATTRQWSSQFLSTTMIVLSRKLLEHEHHGRSKGTCASKDTARHINITKHIREFSDGDFSIRNSSTEDCCRSFARLAGTARRKCSFRLAHANPLPNYQTASVCFCGIIYACPIMQCTLTTAEPPSGR